MSSVERYGTVRGVDFDGLKDWDPKVRKESVLFINSLSENGSMHRSVDRDEGNKHIRYEIFCNCPAAFAARCVADLPADERNALAREIDSLAHEKDGFIARSFDTPKSETKILFIK